MKYLQTSLVLGTLTLMGIYAINLLPVWPVLVSVQEGLLMPGAVASSIFWPEGVHSDGGAYWVVLSIFANFVFYSSLWCIVLYCARLLLKFGERARDN
jgi:hypothetical protein